jgi:hypothetical protein
MFIEYMANTYTRYYLWYNIGIIRYRHRKQPDLYIHIHHLQKHEKFIFPSDESKTKIPPMSYFCY